MKIFFIINVFLLICIEVFGVDKEYKLEIQSKTTNLSIKYENAFLLNGTKLNVLSNVCYSNHEDSTCTHIESPWRLNPISPINSFGTSSHYEHRYLHNISNILFQNEKKSMVVGYAADGFSILTPYVKVGQKIKKVHSSYRLKKGSRKAIKGINPGGEYNGKYRDDYEYVKGLGDLDECNGMFVDGKYAYYITEEFPYTVACFKGTPHKNKIIRLKKENRLNHKGIAHASN